MRLLYKTFIFSMLLMFLSFQQIYGGQEGNIRASAFLKIATDPDSSGTRKQTIKELMEFVEESDPEKAFVKLSALDSIVIYGGNVGGVKRVMLSNLSPFEYFPQLRELILPFNRVVDVSPLSNLVNLKILRLDGNRITDLSPLGDLKKLEELNIDNNRVEDLSPIQDMENLEFFSASGNLIREVAPVDGFTKLQDLNLADNQISNIDPLKNLAGKQVDTVSLNLSDNTIEDIGPLAGLKISVLNIANNQVRDIGPLVNVKSMYELNIKGNPVEKDDSFSRLAEMVSLIHTDSYGNDVQKEKKRKTGEIGPELTGTWRSGTIESEWGRVSVEMRFEGDGAFIQKIQPVQAPKEAFTVEGHYYFENGVLVLEVKTDERKLRVQIEGDLLLLDDGDDKAAGSPMRLKKVSGGDGSGKAGFFEKLRRMLGIRKY